ncbi:MAG: hypothetical protein ACI8Z5_002526 [Lentimonas sp.]|jgi:hypothetical protein
MDDLFQGEKNATTVDCTEFFQQIVYRTKIVLHRYYYRYFNYYTDSKGGGRSTAKKSLCLT